MSENNDPPGEAPSGISMRTMEIAVAIVLMGIGALVVYDSIRLGSSWGADGPEAGYFPFYIGAIICISSAAVFIQNVWGKTGKRHRIFVEWQPLRQVLAVLIPAIFYVLGIQILGLYVASAIYIAVFMRWLGKYSWAKSILLGVAVSAVAFATVEIWFQVPLYKGAFNLLGFLGY